MGGKIWGYDCYNLRQHGVLDIQTFVDIGATAGDVSLMAMILFPFARIVGIEPNKERFDRLKEFEGKRFNFYNIALGDGTPLYIKGKRAGQQKFVPNKTSETAVAVESKTLAQIFSDYNINKDSRFILKCDCEGGEKSLIDDWDNSLPIIQKTIQFNLEIHIGAWNTKEDWNKALADIRKTHNIYIGNWIMDGRKKVKYFYSLFIGDLEEYKHGWLNIMAVKRFGNFHKDNDLYFNSLSPYWKWFCVKGVTNLWA